MYDLTVVVTGHRPPRLGLDYSPRSNLLLTGFASVHLKRMMEVSTDFRVARLISGMAQGWDQAAAHAAVMNGIPLTCALPFDGHGKNWPEAARRRHDAILARAEKVVVVTPGPYEGRKDAHKYIKRDQWMVDQCDGNGLLLALWDGGENGGTWETVRYARMMKVALGNAWDSWEKFKAAPGVFTSVDPEVPSDERVPGLEYPSR